LDGSGELVTLNARSSVASLSADFKRWLTLSGNLTTRRCMATLTGHHSTVLAVAADFNRGLALSGSWDNTSWKLLENEEDSWLEPEGDV